MYFLYGIDNSSLEPRKEDGPIELAIPKQRVMQAKQRQNQQNQQKVSYAI